MNALRSSTATLADVQKTGRCPDCGVRWISEDDLRSARIAIKSWTPALASPPGKSHRRADCTATVELVRGSFFGREQLRQAGEQLISLDSDAAREVSRALGMSPALYDRAQAIRQRLRKAIRICEDCDGEPRGELEKATRLVGNAKAEIDALAIDITTERERQVAAAEIHRREEAAVAALAEHETNAEVAKVRRSTTERIRHAMRAAFGTTRELPVPVENETIPGRLTRDAIWRDSRPVRARSEN